MKKASLRSCSTKTDHPRRRIGEEPVSSKVPARIMTDPNLKRLCPRVLKSCEGSLNCGNFPRGPCFCRPS